MFLTKPIHCADTLYTKINFKWDHTRFLIPAIKSRKATTAMENRDDLYLEGNRYARTTNPTL